MNKTELIDKVAQESALSKSAAEQVVNSVFSAIAETMKTGDKVMVDGFTKLGMGAKKVTPVAWKSDAGAAPAAAPAAGANAAPAAEKPAAEQAGASK